jgi:hypothetical protein
MLQICFGIYIVISMFAFLFFWGILARTRRSDEEKPQKSKQDKIRKWVYSANLRLNS